MNKKSVKIYSHVDGQTMGSHEKFLKKLYKRGAKKEESLDDSDAVIVFCPIVSRFETDINAALSNIPGKKVIVVALHHTYDPNYTVPNNRMMGDKLVVNCLFHEKKGLLSCSCNKTSRKKVCKELNLPGKRWPIITKRDHQEKTTESKKKEKTKNETT